MATGNMDQMKGQATAAAAPPRHGEIDSAKGVLILLVVLGHNILLMSEAEELRRFLYNWHVFGFFLLTFTLPMRDLSARMLGDRAVRYYVPFLAFFTGTSLLNLAIAKGAGIGAWAQAYGMSLLTGFADWTDIASGARYFWFLPALLTLTVMRWLYERARPVALLRPGLLVLAVAGFALAGSLPDAVNLWAPLGLTIAWYAFGPCLLFGSLWQRWRAAFHDRPLPFALAFLVLATVLNGMAWANGSSIILASLTVYNLAEPGLLVLHGALALVNLLALLLVLMVLPNSQVLGWLGRQSLVIYLSHQLFYVMFVRLVVPRLPGGKLEHGLAAYGVAVACACALAALIATVPLLRRVLTPSGAGDFLAALGLSRRNH